MTSLSSRQWMLAWAGFILLAIAQTWPLAAHLSTHVTGIPSGDTGVYVWNTWVFRHELIENGRWPFSTTAILTLAGPASLGLHNYTAVADVLALPLQPWLGIIGAFNVVFMLGVVFSAIGMFLLAHHVTGRAGVAWIAGALFASAPFLVARGTAHYSLAAAGALPFFLYAFDRTWTSGRARDAVLAGLAMAWAAYSDPYYAIYCAMLAVILTMVRVFAATRFERRTGRSPARRVVDVLVTVLLLLMVIVRGLGGGELRAGSLRLSMHTLYTPMLIVAVLLLGRWLLVWRVRIGWQRPPARLYWMAAVMVGTAAVLMGPELYALVELAMESRFVRAPVLWRSSAPGADLLAFLVPNPNHPWTPAVLVDWLSRQPGRFEENVVSLSWVAVAIIVAARQWAGVRPDRLWLIVTVGFGVLALGPFVLVGGHSTHFPTPWTVLRYLPVVGDARMPQRFAVVMFLGLSVLFAQALAAILRAHPARTRLVIGTVSAALIGELVPVPRPLYAASTPAIYHRIAMDPRAVTVLDVPFGVRDGLSSIGDFSARSQLDQTVHGKALLGGYLSRVDERTKAVYQDHPLLSVLIAFSESRVPDDAALDGAARHAAEFAANTRLGYVVIDRARVTDAARDRLISWLSLERIAEEGNLELYGVPVTVPAVTPAERSEHR